MKQSISCVRARYASIASIAALLAGCSGGGGSSVPLAPPNPGVPQQSVAQAPLAAYPDFVDSLDAVPFDDSADATCKPSSKPPATKTVPLPVNGGTVTIPMYNGFTGGATTPPISKGQGSRVTIKDSTNNFDKQPIPAGQHGVFFTSLDLSKQVTFKTPTIRSNVKSKCLVNGATYTVNVYAFGGMIQATETVKAMAGEIRFTVTVPLGGTFPANTPADIVLSK